jgi:hypothetical protein
MNVPLDTNTLFSAAELGDVLGADLETVNNWIRRGIINRSRIGGRQLRHRLFSAKEVYKAALTRELVKLGIPPSSASDGVNEFWKAWDQKEFPDGRTIYAVLLPINDNWSVLLCWQKLSGGALYKLGKSSSSKAEEIELPEQAFAMLPISDVFAHVAKKLTELLNDIKQRGTRGARS